MQILHCVQMTIQSRYDCTRVLRSVKHPANCDVRQRLVALLGKNVQTSRGDKSPSYTEPTISMSVCRIEPPASVWNTQPCARIAARGLLTPPRC